MCRIDENCFVVVFSMSRGDIMATKAQIRANNKYKNKAYDRIEVTVPKGVKERWRALAEQEGKSLNAYIVSRVEGAPVPVDAPEAPADP